MTNCSIDAWHGLWLAFHANPFDEIYLPRQKLEEVLACHLQFQPEFSPKSILVKTPNKLATRVLVRRAPVFEFLVAHGKCACDNPKLQKERVA